MDDIPDRRIKPRVLCDYPVTYIGYDLNGKKFKQKGKLANLSASGLFMSADRCIETGSKLSVTVLLSTDVVDRDTPKIATNGIVVRSEPHEDGSCGIAVKFQNYRFM